jgi:hypothetical protein
MLGSDHVIPRCAEWNKTDPSEGHLGAVDRKLGLYVFMVGYLISFGMRKRSL